MSLSELFEIAFIIIKLGSSYFIIGHLGVSKVWVKGIRMGLIFGYNCVVEAFKLDWC